MEASGSGTESTAQLLRFSEGKARHTSTSGVASATTSGHHGEFIQGPVMHQSTIETALVTLPDLRERSEGRGVFHRQRSVDVETRPHRPKVIAALRAAGELLRIGGFRTTIDFTRSIPMSKGLGSSTADIITGLRCLSRALNVEISSETVAAICHHVEGAIDPTMFTGAENILFASRKPAVLAEFDGDLPPFVMATFDASAVMGTVDTRDVKFAYAPAHLSIFRQAIHCYRRALRDGSTRQLQVATTMSAQLNQQFLAMPSWGVLSKVASRYGLGIQIAHTGSVTGLVAEPGTRASLDRAVKELTEETEFSFTGLINRGWK